MPGGNTDCCHSKLAMMIFAFHFSLGPICVFSASVPCNKKTLFLIDGGIETTEWRENNEMCQNKAAHRDYTTPQTVISFI